jgi:hypothetical protein
MTEPVAPHRPARRTRLPRRVVRSWAYVGGAVSFVIPWAMLNQAPRPATAESTTGSASGRPVIEVHRTIRRIVIDAPSAPVSSGKPQVRYVYVGGGGGGGGASASTHCSTCP